MSEPSSRNWWPPGWVWIGLLGAGMVAGGILAWLVAATRVVLPYDEAFVGLSRAELDAVNGRLLAFLAHDRVTLAGTMIAIGVLYGMLALHPMRAGFAWARRAVLWSGAVGFSSFFLFLGFGYFDPLHALVTVLLLPFFVLGMASRPPGPAPVVSWGISVAGAQIPGLTGTSWGQFLFVAVGASLFVAGIALAGIGVTVVFVPEDLEFMGTTREALSSASPRLIPMIAHDRAGLGGALLSNGLAVLLPALWGYQRGARWLWWALFGSGVPGFVAALGTHVAVGYTDLGHLAPALAGLVMYAAALALSARHLLRPVPLSAGVPPS
ncbi:MAG: hypothetical protein AB7P40_25350 [Chloroflexota bacterium]